MESLSWSKTSEGVFQNSKNKNWENVYYKDKELNDLLNSILLKYIMRPPNPPPSKPGLAFKINNKTKNILDDIFMMIHQEKFDIFANSAKLVKPELISYYRSTNRLRELKKKSQPAYKTKNSLPNSHLPSLPDENSDQKMKKSSTVRDMDFQEEAYEIKMNMINLIDDIMRGIFGSYERLSQGLQIDKAIKHNCDWIINYLKKGDKSAHDGNFYYRQMCLSENYLVVLLLTLSTIILEFEKTETLKLILRTLTLICKNNETSHYGSLGDHFNF